MAKKSAISTIPMSRLSKDEIEANAVAELSEEGVSPVGVTLKTAELLSGIVSRDLLRAIARSKIDARFENGRIIVIYDSLKNYVLALPAMEAR